MSVGLGAGVAHAGGYSLHVLGTTQVAWTDNLFSVPSDSDPGLGLPGREADVYYQIRPGALATYETPRTMHQLSYDLEANLYTRHDEAWSLQHMAGWRGFFLPSPRSELGASAQVSTGALTTLSTRTAASDGTISALPSGESRFLAVDVGQNYAYTATRDLRLTQGARGRSFSTTDALGAESSGVEVGLSAGGDRTWKYSAAALQLSSSFVTLERTVAGMAAESNDQINASLVASWRRDFGPRWSSLLDAGATTIVPLATGEELLIQPTVGAQVGYFPEWGSAGLALRRSVAPNLYLAQNTITDSIIANAWLPLPWLAADRHLPRLTVQGTLGAQRTRLLDTATGDVQSGFDVYAGDLALVYAPRDGVTVALRVQHLRQVTDEDAVMNVLGYVRNTVMITATGRFPDRVAAEIPVRSSMRVDRSNLTPVGEEVVPAGGATGGAP